MAKQTTVYNAVDERKLIEAVLKFGDDPLAFVMFIFPWGKKGTPLADSPGPRAWQKEVLAEIRVWIKENNGRRDIGLLPEVLREAISSGRGPGKSALVAWLALWNMSCHLGSTTIITANTEQQLKTRTMAEAGKWHTLALNRHWFERSVLSLKPAEWFAEALKADLGIDTEYYYIHAQLWSEENPDAFAGVHNPLGLLVLYDEASGIPEAIWVVTEGFFTEPVLHRYWFVFSNPRRPTGAFFECFHKHRNLWKARSIDARTVEGKDSAAYQHIIDKYGADSDIARVEVYGQFPRQGDRQFISRETVELASLRELTPDTTAPLIMGVDVARFGADSSVIRWRQGRDGRSIPPVRFKGLDNMQFTYEVAKWINLTNPDAVCVDAGNGTGVIDRLRELGYKVHEVWFGAKTNEDEWGNTRTLLWARMREWLRGGCIEVCATLLDDLAGPEYVYRGAGDTQILESKEDMKKRGLASPDDGDALALTFAVKVPSRDMSTSRTRRQRVAEGVNGPVFNEQPAAPSGIKGSTAMSTRDWMKNRSGHDRSTAEGEN